MAIGYEKFIDTPVFEQMDTVCELFFSKLARTEPDDATTIYMMATFGPVLRQLINQGASKELFQKALDCFKHELETGFEQAEECAREREREANKSFDPNLN
jgi:hypothetical protein